MEITPLNSLAHSLRKLIEGKLWLKVLIAIAIGAGIGVLLNPDTQLVSMKTSTTIGNWLALPGTIFLKLVQMIMIPLIFTSIVTGILSNSGDQLKRMGPRLLVYFVATTFVSIFIGTLLALVFRPGALVREKGIFELPPLQEPPSQGNEIFENIPQAISELIPSNPLAAMISGEMLPIVIFTVIIGLAMTQLSAKTLGLTNKAVETMQKVCMTVVSWAMQLVPYAVFGLVAQLTSSLGADGLLSIGYYMAVVLLGLFVLLVIYLILVGIVGQRSPFTFMKKITSVQLLAFSTTSSAAVMPLTMKTADEELGVSSKVSDLIIPIGATINMDGTALFQCISALFLAQAFGVELSLANIAVMMLTIVAASIGTPAIPGGGVVILASVLQSIGIPAEGLVIIVGVDRILGMFRTAVNVTGDLTACLVFERWMGK